MALMLNWVHEPGAEFIIFADGHKYGRACTTPSICVQEYQEGLAYWADALGISRFVKIKDYEEAVKEVLSDAEWDQREADYNSAVLDIRAALGMLFDPVDVPGSLDQLRRRSQHGAELQFIYYSIASSVFYKTASLGRRLKGHDDLAQVQFVLFLASLECNLANPDHTVRLLYNSGLCREEVVQLRLEIWEATLRYIAISLCDRTLQIWTRLLPDGIKLTIHGKSGEVQFRPTSSSHATMTAQHCVGGIRDEDNGLRVTYAYRLEREARGDIPLLFDDTQVGNINHNDDYLHRFCATKQPICYLDRNLRDHKAALVRSFMDV